MKKEGLYRLAFLLALAGLTLMYGATFLEPQKVHVSELKPAMVGEKVKISGTVQEPSGSKHFFFTLKEGNSTVRAVKFDTSPGYTSGAEVTVTGEITMYKGELEIIVQKIRPR
ncbi:hypothetical protein GKQ38_04440 [Candidatus Nanohaloarchaea archaeon]|nr:hypothetical protein GKQ38_04440 [Candidatus Nanohaloarchaea archaeon]